MRLWIAGVGVLIGSVILVLSLRGLKESGQVAYHNNPFALKMSAYGTLLARLGQKNLDRAWHNGAVASELARQEHKEGDGHDHGDEGKKEEDGGTHDEGHEGHEGHDQGKKDEESPQHDHEFEQLEEKSPIGSALDFLVDLDAERFRRTSPFALSESHKKAIALDIEKLLLRSYNMDPTDYGVYNSYYHFLTLHAMRGTPEARKHARKISEHTFRLVQRENVDPMPWLTAAEAVLNQFLMEQQDLAREKPEAIKKSLSKVKLPKEVLMRYRDQMGYCLSRYGALRDLAVKEGRWLIVPQERRDEAENRAYTAGKLFEQFDAMLKRQNKPAL